MKITKEHYAALEKQITDFCKTNPEWLEKQVTNFCKANPEWFKEQSKLLSTAALGWRIVILSGCIPFSCDNLYRHLNDNHITSALKVILNNYKRSQQ